MTAGIQIFHENGRLNVDITNELLRFIKKQQIGVNQALDITIDGRVPNNKVWYLLYPANNAKSGDYRKDRTRYLGDVSVSGGRLTITSLPGDVGIIVGDR